MQAAEESEGALLVFSGGYTRRDAGARSEAGSYWLVADAMKWFGAQGVRDRALLEDRARDSFENLLFSVCRFRQFSGSYPQKITIVSYDFKRTRFLKMHALSLGYSESQVNFIGTPALDASAFKVRLAAPRMQPWSFPCMNASQLYAHCRKFSLWQDVLHALVREHWHWFRIKHADKKAVFVQACFVACCTCENALIVSDVNMGLGRICFLSTC
jgi:hypothetical protein